MTNSAGMQNQINETLGQFLKKERESRNISREELSKATRIGLPFLQALEENDFDFFSRAEFIPGFLRVYSRHLGLDYEEVIRRYHIQSERNRLQKSFQQLPLFWDINPSVEKDPAPKGIPQKSNSKIWILLGIIAASLALSSFLHYHYSKGKSPLLPFLSIDLGNLGRQIWGNKSPSPPAPPPPALAPPATEEPKGPPPPEATVPAVSPHSSPPPRLEMEKPEPPPPPEKMMVIGNRDSKLYHLPGMKYYQNVNAYHRVEFKSEEEAIKAGYRKAPR
jgi:transcriptional regulator with XRE-family HTH domain